MLSDDPLETAYGPFAVVFSPGELDVPGHLPLLGLQIPNVQVVLDRIAGALSGDPRLWLVRRSTEAAG